MHRFSPTKSKACAALATEAACVPFNPAPSARMIFRKFSRIDRFSLQSTGFLLVFWALAEIALIWHDTGLQAPGFLAVQSSPQAIQVAEWPEEPLYRSAKTAMIVPPLP